MELARVYVSATTHMLQCWTHCSEVGSLYARETSRIVMLRHVVICCVMLRHAMLCYAMLCYALLCYAMLCDVL